MDLKIRKLKLGLINYLDSTGLPPEVMRMVLKEVYEEMEKRAVACIEEQLMAEETARETAGREEQRA